MTEVRAKPVGQTRGGARTPQDMGARVASGLSLMSKALSFPFHSLFSCGYLLQSVLMGAFTCRQVDPFRLGQRRHMRARSGQLTLVDAMSRSHVA